MKILLKKHPNEGDSMEDNVSVMVPRRPINSNKEVLFQTESYLQSSAKRSCWASYNNATFEQI